MNTLIGYKKCSTCTNAEKMLQGSSLEYNYREIDKDLLNVDKLREIREKADIDLNKLFNSNGKDYRELNLKDKKKDMTEDEIYDLLSKNGMLVKRPILITDEGTFVGPQVKKYLESMKDEKDK